MVTFDMGTVAASVFSTGFMETSLAHVAIMAGDATTELRSTPLGHFAALGGGGTTELRNASVGHFAELGGGATDELRHPPGGFSTEVRMDVRVGLGSAVDVRTDEAPEQIDGATEEHARELDYADYVEREQFGDDIEVFSVMAESLDCDGPPLKKLLTEEAWHQTEILNCGSPDIMQNLPMSPGTDDFAMSSPWVLSQSDDEFIASLFATI